MANNLQKKACVIGMPAKHSLSPVIHNFWLDQYKIEGLYDIKELQREEFSDFLLNIDRSGYVGCNITVPYKEEAYNLLKMITAMEVEVGAEVHKIGALNTCLFEGKKIIARNTDCYGFIQNIKENIKNYSFPGKTVMLLGAGGAARGIIYGLLQEGVKKIFIVNRTKDKALKIKKDFIEEGGRLEVRDWESRNELYEIDILINSTLLGMQGQGALEIDLVTLPKTSLVCDIVYKPLMTDLLKAGFDRGNLIVDGLGMLLYQAVPGFELWFKIRPVVTKELREKIESLF